jgi:hypothetical protein
MASHRTDFYETPQHSIILVVMCYTEFCSPERMHTVEDTPFAAPTVSDTVLVCPTPNVIQIDQAICK